MIAVPPLYSFQLAQTQISLIDQGRRLSGDALPGENPAAIASIR